MDTQIFGETVVFGLGPLPVTTTVLTSLAISLLLVAGAALLAWRARRAPGTILQVKVYLARYSGTAGIQFNTDVFPEGADPRVRLAVAHAINRKEIAEKIQGGVCEPATSIISPGTFGYLD